MPHLSRSRLFSSPCAGTSLLWASFGASVWASAATAQITVDDVVTNAAALYDSIGATQSVTLTRDGAVVTAGQDRLLWSLPMGLGTATVTFSDYTLTENGDASVTITYPTPFRLSVEVAVTGEGSGSVDLVMAAAEDFVTTATGTPGAISYLSSTGPFTLGIENLVMPTLPDMPDAGDMIVEVTYSAEGSETLTRVVEDSLVVVFSETSIGPSNAVFSVTGPDDFSSFSEASYGASTATTNMGLIPGGVDILDLATALRDGMYVNTASSSEGSTSLSESYAMGSLFDRQEIASGPASAAFRFDRDGVRIEGAVRDVVGTIEQPMIDSPIGFDMTEASGAIQVPLLADPAAQDFAYRLKLDALRLGQPIWALFDPDKRLDRSPASLGIDVSGSVVNKVDWLDVLALEGLTFENTLPAEITSITIADLSLAALGARISGQGAFTFDAGDTFTYPGFPRPTGEAAVDASGVNTAIDMLADAGMIPPDALLGVRMGLGMVSVPGPEPDTLSSRIEMTADGQIIANGQRLR